MTETRIVKRRGYKEAYDEKKIYASVYAASLNAHLNKLEAEKIAERVSRELTIWIEERPETGSDEIFRRVFELLGEENKDAAFMYRTHRDLA